MAKRRPSGDGMVRKREDGRWEGRIVVGHKKNGDPIHRYVLARTQKELTVKLHDCIEMYRDADLTEDSNMTLGEWLDRWINEYMIFTIRESTLDSYKAMIKNQIKPYLGDRPLSALTTQELQKFYNSVKKKGRVKPDKLHGTELADSMVRGIHMMLHEALDMAVRLRLIVKNPTVGTTIPKNNYPPKQILNDEQLDRFMKRIRQDERWYDFFYTELTTGLRRGEICGLKWEDFDAENGKLKVRRSVAKRKGGGLNIGETKTETGTRTIVLPPSTAELLRKRKETAVSEWIFPNIYEPEKPMHPDYAYHRLKTLLKQAELPLIRFHDLRHTFATHALAGGVDAKTLSGILGHTNASFTVNIKNPYEQLNESKQLDFVCIMKRANHKQTCLRLALFNNYLEFCCTILSYSEQRVSSRIGFFNSHSQTVSTFQPCEERFSATRLSRAILVLIFSSQNSVFVFGITKYLQFV